MRVRRFVCVWVCVVQCAWAAVASVNAVFLYPDARRDESVVEDYHGTKVKDPYRWLEDPDSDETKAFVDGQNNITLPYLEACPEREAINKRIKELWDFPKYTSPFREGDRYYYFKNDGLQPQKILYTQDSLKGEPRVFFDPNTLSEDGTVALASFKFTKDGATFAYALSKKGSDWNTVYFRDVATGKDYPEKLEKVKFSSLAWTNDYKGLFYSAYPEQAGKTDGSETVANRDQKLCYHRLDTPQSEDVIVAEFPKDPLWRMNGDVSDDGRYLLVSVVKEYRDNLMFFADLSQYENVTGLLPLKQIIFKFDAEYGYVTNDGPVCVFRTNKNAANYRLVKIDLDNPAEENWETLVEEHPKSVMNFVYPVDNDKLMIHYIKDVKSILQLHSLRTGEVLQTFEDFGVGTVVEFTGQRHQTEAFFYFWSYLTPGIIYHVDFNSTAPYKSEVFREIQLKDFDKSKFAFKQIFYPSKDGTSIPMYIVSKKDLPRDGCNPTLLYGYGGFNINSSPDFNIMRLVFMENFNGIVAIANIRGGGEYGERWYRAGRSLNKQNVFDDFQAAAEYLIAEQYTNPELLTIQGASNGGLLVAACINQRPDLYSAAIISIGVLDLLRFHKFTIGSAWVYDYGSSDNKTEFENLIKLSPLHNIRPPGDGRAQYPATLVLTADHDDRVVPLHSLKFIAALQHAVRGSAQARPLLARVDTKAGHGGGKPIGKIIQSDTDILCFIMQALQLKYVK